MIQHIKVALKLEAMHETAKRFFGDEFLTKIKPYQENIRKVMKEESVEVIPALLKISKTQHYRIDAKIQLMYMAATAEMLLNDTNQKLTSFSKETAKQVLNSGKKVFHRNFSEGEWVRKIAPSTLVTEDGYEIAETQFWADRSNESWNDGWSIVK